jgi:micrococcal nuclease
VKRRVLTVLMCVLVSCSSEGPADEETAQGRVERSPAARATRGERGGAHRHVRRTGRRGKTSPRRAHGTHKVLVTRVVDGDTIEVERRGVTVIRLIGVDTPETVDPTEPVECYGRAASDFTTRFLLGDRVRLEFDVERTDHYGRTLAYVWDGATLFNRLLVERGLGTVATYPPNVEHEASFVAAERKARDGNRGLWRACDTRTNSEPDSGRRARAGYRGGCDPNYAGACVPRYPPDLDCGNVPSGFRSIGSDPHGLDVDGDGIACEG